MINAHSSLPAVAPTAPAGLQIAVRLDARVRDKADAIAQAARLLQDRGCVAPGYATGMQAREAQAETFLGHGVAIPHGRIKGLTAPMAAVFQLDNPIGFDAPDEQPVGLLIFLLVPEAATQKHLEILSEIAELLSDSQLRERLKSCADAARLHGMIAGWQSSAAPLV